MNQKTIDMVGVFLVLLIIMLPFGWILLAHEPPGPFTTETSAGMVKEAMAEAGISICKETENTWDVPGAAGGRTYLISSDCGAVGQYPGITVHVQKFVTEETRDAMIRGFNSQTRGRPNGVLLTRGSSIILVQGLGHGEIASVLKERMHIP